MDKNQISKTVEKTVENLSKEGKTISSKIVSEIVDKLSGELQQNEISKTQAEKLSRKLLDLLKDEN